MSRIGDSNTCFATLCARRVSDSAFIGCKTWSQSSIAYGNPPATIRGAQAVWSTSGNANDYATASSASYANVA